MPYPPRHILAGALLIVGLTGCGGDSANDTSTPAPTTDGTSATETVGTPASTPASTPEESASQPTATEAPLPSASPTDMDGPPQSWFSRMDLGEVPDLPTAEDVAIVMTAPPDGGLIPIAIHNGSDGPISNIEVSGRALDGAGDTLGQGAPQGFEPTNVPAGEHTFGYVYIGTDDLPEDVTLDDPSIDFDEGVGDFENEVAVDVAEPEQLDDAIIGKVVNPHEIPVTGPISVQIACFNEAGDLTTVKGSFAERDELEPGDSSTFEISFFGDFDCSAGVLAASGYSNDF